MLRQTQTPASVSIPCSRRHLCLVGLYALLLPQPGMSQGMCKATGPTVEELLAELATAEKRKAFDSNAFVLKVERNPSGRALVKGIRKKDGKEVVTEEWAIPGKLYLNDKLLGDVVENEAYLIPTGEYRGYIDYFSENGKNNVQGPYGEIAAKGDFRVRADVSGRPGILFHQGTKPQHSEGCILAGAAKREKVGGKDYIRMVDDSPLRAMRQAFYGTDGEPKECPSKKIRVVVK